MSTRDPQVPPGRSRIAAAARAGLFPRAGPLVSGAVLLAAAGALGQAGAPVVGFFRSLVDGGLSSAVRGRPDPAQVLIDSAVSALGGSLWFFLVLLCTALIAAVVPAVRARWQAGTTAAPLPGEPSNRLARGSFRLVGAAVFLLWALLVLRRRSGEVWLVLGGETSGLGAVLGIGPELLAGAGVALLLVGLAELLLTRHAIWRALFLTEAEARRERRASGEESPVKRRRQGRARSEGGR